MKQDRAPTVQLHLPELARTAARLSPGDRLADGATTSTAGLKVYAQLDEGTYERGVKVSDAKLAAVNLTRVEFRGEWNYSIKPQSC